VFAFGGLNNHDSHINVYFFAGLINTFLNSLARACGAKRTVVKKVESIEFQLWMQKCYFPHMSTATSSPPA
jgi:hypothetical protein